MKQRARRSRRVELADEVHTQRLWLCDPARGCGPTNFRGFNAARLSIAGMSRSPLELALAARDVERVRSCISDGSDVDLPFGDGLTPLCRAAALGERKILKLLLAANAADAAAAAGAAALAAAASC